MMTTKKRESRRHKGEGGLSQRADGMWIASVSLPEGGRRKRARKNYNEAIVALAELRREVEDGITATNSMTVEGWMNYWLPEIAYTRLKPRTYATYRYTVNAQIIPRLGSKKLDKLTPMQVRTMTNKITAERSSRTAQATFNILSKAMKDAVKNGKVRYNVCDRLDRPTALSEKREGLTASQVKTLFRHLIEKDDSAATARWAMALFTGARQGECLGLEWSRVDFDNKVIDISWSLSRIKLKPGSRPAEDVYPRSAFDAPATFDFKPVWRSQCLVPPKTAGSKRVVPMIAPLEAALLAHRANSAGMGLVWTESDGGPLRSRDDTKAWRDALIASGLYRDPDKAKQGEVVPPIPTQHVSRHTVATLLQDAGVDESVRMAILGHTTITAHRGYAHVNQDRARAALDNLTKILE